MDRQAIKLSGKKLAAKTQADVAVGVAARGKNGLSQPALATILIGEDPASQVYVRSKHKACEKVGIRSVGYEMASDVNQEQVLELVHNLNAESDLHGILVQLPMPKHIDEAAVLTAISLEKDVDALHPHNVGLLAQKGRQPLFTSATPSGIMRLLDDANIKLEGARVFVLGRSNIVGLPLALMMIKADATVTICHSRSKDLPDLCRQADVLVAAVGKPELVRVDWVKPGAVVIDVGVNRVEDKTSKKGYRLVGDVAYDEVRQVAKAITPVPGGVGPMTIAILMENTLHAAELADQ